MAALGLWTPRSGFNREDATAALAVTTSAVGAAFAGGFLRSPEGHLVVNVGGAVARQEGGLPRDTAGALVVAKDVAVATDARGLPRDTAGRVVITENAGVTWAGGFFRDAAGRIVVKGLPSAITPFASDSFTDTAGTVLTAHAMTLGGPWVAHSGGGTACQITAQGRARQAATGNALLYATAAPAGVDQTVEARVSRWTGTGAVGVAARMDTVANTFYSARWDSATLRWQLHKCVAAAFTLLGESASVPPAAGGGSALLRLTVTNAAKRLYVDGVELVSNTTDNAITGAGRCGFRISGTGAPGDAAAHQLDDFLAADGAVAP